MRISDWSSDVCSSDLLGRLIVETCDPTAGPLLHIAGSVTAGDLAGHLRAAGFDLRRDVLYDARTAEALDERVAATLAAGEIDLALFFSDRKSTRLNSSH